MKGLDFSVPALRAEDFERLRLRSRRESEHREVGGAAALLHLGQDGVLELLLGGLGPCFFLLRLFEVSRGQNGLETLRAFARLRRVRFVHDHGEAMAGELYAL